MKVCLITGGNQGLGFGVAKLLASQENWHIILCCRNQTLAEKAVTVLTPQTAQGTRVTYSLLDLSNLSSVQSFVEKGVKEAKIDLLLCNAGIWGSPQVTLSKDTGIDLTLATNHLGHFALVLSLLQKSKFHPKAKIVVISSSLHDPKTGRGGPEFDFDDLKWSRGQYNPQTCYQNSKLANIWFTYQLHKYLKGISSGIIVNALSPGWVPQTALNRNMTGVGAWIYNNMFQFLPMTVSLDDSCKFIFNVCTSPEWDNVSGKYFTFEKSLTESSVERYAYLYLAWEIHNLIRSYNEAKALKLWTLSIQLCSKIFSFTEFNKAF